MTTYPLSLVEFKSWLEAKDETDKIGWQGWCQGCPIFKCLKDKNPNMDIDKTCVNRKTTYINSELLENPYWVQEFIIKIDSLPIVVEHYNYEMNTPITAQQALEVVNNLYICTVCNKYNPEGKNCGKDKCDW